MPPAAEVLPAHNATAEEALTAVMENRPEVDIKSGKKRKEVEQTIFEGTTIAEYLLDMDGVEKEKLARIAGGESYFMDGEAADVAVAASEEYRKMAEDSGKSLT